MFPFRILKTMFLNTFYFQSYIGNFEFPWQGFEREARPFASCVVRGLTFVRGLTRVLALTWETLLNETKQETFSFCKPFATTGQTLRLEK